MLSNYLPILIFLVIATGLATLLLVLGVRTVVNVTGLRPRESSTRK